MICRCLYNRYLNKVWLDFGYIFLIIVYLKKKIMENNIECFFFRL